VTGGTPAAQGFTRLPDLASRLLGGSVVVATDELFADKENLIKPDAPEFVPRAFGNKGKIYDGWETRRRRDGGHDHVIIRLGTPGIVRGVVVDTSFFRGNYPPKVSVEAVRAEGYPTPGELAELDWQALVPPSDAAGDTANCYQVDDERCWTHMRLSIYPDGGVARFRVHGEAVPDPAFLAGTIDLAAAENGGMVTGCSDAFYASAANLLLPGRARGMAEGWENARRRGPGNDYVEVQLAGRGRLRHAEIDTSWFVGNAPGWARLTAADKWAPRTSVPGGGLPEETWWEALPRTRLQPDTRHRFLLPAGRVASHIRLDVYPDGGLARLRVFGELIPESLAWLRRRWAVG
jgi:allantoicase